MSPERFELVDMGLTSASFSWLSDPHTDAQQAYRLHYKSLSSDDDYGAIEVRISAVSTTFLHVLHVGRHAEPVAVNSAGVGPTLCRVFIPLSCLRSSSLSFFFLISLHKLCCHDENYTD